MISFFPLLFFLTKIWNFEFQCLIEYWPFSKLIVYNNRHLILHVISRSIQWFPIFSVQSGLERQRKQRGVPSGFTTNAEHAVPFNLANATINVIVGRFYGIRDGHQGTSYSPKQPEYHQGSCFHARSRNQVFGLLGELDILDRRRSFLRGNFNVKRSS